VPSINDEAALVQDLVKYHCRHDFNLKSVNGDRQTPKFDCRAELRQAASNFKKNYMFVFQKLPWYVEFNQVCRGASV